MMTTLKYLIMRKRMNKPYATLEDIVSFSPYVGRKSKVLANLKKLAEHNLVVIKNENQFAITKAGELTPAIVTIKHRQQMQKRGKLQDLSGDE
jgi:hypothetical protein